MNCNRRRKINDRSFASPSWSSPSNTLFFSSTVNTSDSFSFTLSKSERFLQRLLNSVSLFPSSPYFLIPEPEGKTLDSFSVTWWNCNQSRKRNSLSFLFFFFSDMTWFTYFFFFLSFSWNWLNSLLIRQNYWRNPISLCLCLRLFLGLTIPFPEPFFIN